MTQSIRQKKAGTEDQKVFIGYDDLRQDTETVKRLLTLSGVAGVMMNVGKSAEEPVYVYRPSTPSLRGEDVTREMRKFLTIFAILKGKGSLTIVKSPRRIPEGACDFEKVYQSFKEKYSLSED